MSDEDFPTPQDEERDFMEFEYPELFYGEEECCFRRTGKRLKMDY